LKKYLKRFFIDGLGGMSLGIFCTLILGTILGQLSIWAKGDLSSYLNFAANIAKTITGAGIGVGVASKLKESPFVTIAAALTGMIGAFPEMYKTSAFVFGNPGEPLSAFIAAYIAIEVGHLIFERTKAGILITPVLSILTGGVMGVFLGQYITKFTRWLGNLITINVDNSPIIGGIIVSVFMGMLITLPFSSAAILMSFNISGLALGAATVGCCCQMVGFAVASYNDNKFEGLIAQGLGTSMLQLPNIMKRPLIWLPPIIASAILGPISSGVLKMVCKPSYVGVGSLGIIGQLNTYSAMTANNVSNTVAVIEIILMHFVLPGLITFFITKGFKHLQLIKDGDMYIQTS